ncbi:hypothetical protein GF323_05160 [Candidatus Woesearchaeota archaeon]|nr:hypothetical protein [Candidatus Woesearchaeota archaeon]
MNLNDKYVRYNPIKVKKSILSRLISKRDTISGISKSPKFDWSCTKRNLEELKELGLVYETHRLSTHRIFKITKMGKESVKKWR